ncbi:hypothetical protein AVEN_240374-1 [Araneus ventricosus]|uniref:Uncharacterized protein n=1 Tax=Araneus ventricosus TaxID=182803 RepID=A0A4Y2F3A3_ARAVE|nr:hypothetical protein AVEN_240374-1 [Araneus ventricosus]
MYHPSNGSPRTANTWGLQLPMKSRKQTEQRQLLKESPLTCCRGIEGTREKKEGIEESIIDGSKDPWEPRDWDTRTHLKKASP